ncbi:hypothetical protein Poly41_19930 [Novipirellula artificiosorum]|uniref:Uncharacterized protein n=2 Tax=Novipirellula artificiosorum TaxID=2528016 RepID=A0A5C6DUR1_9BACT|nr:hypothetical protein Poly41_19930 [Novipirellula artificiosorum]
MPDAKRNSSPASVQPLLRSRLLPRISFRFVFALTTFAAIVASVARVAGDGGALAKATIVALIYPAVCLCTSVVLFLFAWAITTLWFKADDQDTLHGNPFAEGQLPPQILPPREKGV